MKKTLLLIVGILFLIPISVSATNSFDLTCDKTTVAPGDTVSCSVSTVSDGNVGIVGFLTNVSDNLEIISASAATSDWTVQFTSNRLSATYSADPGSGASSGEKFAILSIKAKEDATNGDGSLTLSEGTYAIKNGESESEEQVDDAKVDFKIDKAYELQAENSFMLLKKHIEEESK